MFGTIVRFVAAVALVGLLGIVGVNIYQAGYVAGAAADGAAVIAPWAGYGPGWGFGHGFSLFGFLGTLLIIFLVIGLIRAAVGSRHGWGPGGWGPGGRQHGHGPRGWDAESFRGTPWEARAREVHDAWHRGAGEPGEGGGSADR